MGQKRAALEILEAVEVIDDDGLKDPKTHATTQVSALFHTGKLMLEVGRASEAVDALQKAANRGRTIHYALQGILNVLGEAYQALNKTREAERSFRAALQAKPDHIPAYLTYGKLLAKNVSNTIIDDRASWELPKQKNHRRLSHRSSWLLAFTFIID